MNTETLPLSDIVLPILASEIRSKSKGRPIQVVSDFDETLVSRYIFSARLNTHIPIIKSAIVTETNKLELPLCVATARAANESVSRILWHKLCRDPMPLVAENGAVLVWPSANKGDLPKVEILASWNEIQVIQKIQNELQNGLLKKLTTGDGHEIILRSNRHATVEIRTQEIANKKGTPEDYKHIRQQLAALFVEAMSIVNIVSSGSSISIQPKSVSKRNGIVAAFERAHIDCENIYLVGLGDNENDEPLFSLIKNKQGTSIGVRNTAANFCDYLFTDGDLAALAVLHIVNELKV